MLTAALAGVSGLMTGCGDDSGKPEAKIAEEAVGIQNQREKKSSEVTRKVDVVEEIMVKDEKTGEILSKKKAVTPVVIKKETAVSTDVNVKVGDTQSSGK
ncbi:MAG: hypothetical protein JO284_12435 [Planctomycetaceae bacterium]|nr:hypothetical protein [Planctomycetaceae bacterium]